MKVWVITAALLLVGGVALVIGLGGERAPVSELDQLVALNPGVSKAEMQAEVQAQADAHGLTMEQVISQALAEAQRSAERR